MTQSIPPVSTSSKSTVNNSQESPKSWWDTLVGFLFAEDQGAEPVEALKDKKIMEIDPDLLRQKRLPNQGESTSAAQGKATSQPPLASDSKSGIAVDEKMRQLAQQRLDRLSSRLAAVGERLASLEKDRLKYTQQLAALGNENTKASNALKPLRQVPRMLKQRGEFKDVMAQYEKQIAALNKEIEEVARKEEQVKNDSAAINAAIGKAQKVVDLLKSRHVMPQQLQRLESAAKAAELSLTKA